MAWKQKLFEDACVIARSTSRKQPRKAAVEQNYTNPVQAPQLTCTRRPSLNAGRCTTRELAEVPRPRGTEAEWFSLACDATPHFGPVESAAGIPTKGFATTIQLLDE